MLKKLTLNLLQKRISINYAIQTIALYFFYLCFLCSSLIQSTYTVFNFCSLYFETFIYLKYRQITFKRTILFYLFLLAD